MGWQKIDDQFGVSQKVIRIPRKRRHQVVGLWTLAGNYAARALTDGRLEAHELEEIDAKPVDVAELVRVGLWHRHGEECDSDSCVTAPTDGISIHDYLRYNPSRVEVESAREAERVRKAAQRDRQRVSGGSPTGTPAGSDAASEHPVPSRPVPYDLTETNESSHVLNAGVPTDEMSPIMAKIAGQAGLTSVPAIVEQIRKHTGRDVTADRAVHIAGWVLEKAKTTPRAPQRYVFTAISQSPHEVAQYIDESGLAS